MSRQSITRKTKHTTWIVICDSGMAKFFINHGARDGVHEMSEECHPIPKISEMITDKRGRNKPGGKFLMRHAFDPPTDPRVHEKEVFLRYLARELNQQEKEIPRLLIAAPPKALHMLREELCPQLRKKIVAEVTKDLTQETEITLPQHLKEYMRIYDPLHDFTTPGRHH